MMKLIARLFARGEAALSPATPRDAAAIAALHAASFRRGWSEQEVETLLLDRHVIADRASRRGAARRLHHVAPGRGRGGNPLGRGGAWRARAAGWPAGCSPCICAGWPVSARARSSWRSTSTTTPAIRLYTRAGFREVARRPNYYPDATGKAADALVLRRDLG